MVDRGEFKDQDTRPVRAYYQELVDQEDSLRKRGREAVQTALETLTTEEASAKRVQVVKHAMFIGQLTPGPVNAALEYLNDSGSIHWDYAEDRLAIIPQE
jgi:hypothetical protein